MKTSINNSPKLISGYQSFSGKDYKFFFYVPFRGSEETIKAVLLKIYQAQSGLGNQFFDNSPLQEKVEHSSSLKKLEQVLKSYKNGMLTIEMKSIQTFSFQIHTDIQRVVTTRFKYPRGFTMGPRLVAGSIICTVLDEHPFMEIMEMVNLINAIGSENNFEYESILSVLYNVESSSSVVDEIPPMNVIIKAKNEQGDKATQTIYGLKLINDGSVYSVQDILTEATFTFMAQDIDLLRNEERGSRNPHQSLLGLQSGSALLNTDIAKARRKLKRGLVL